MNDMKLRMEFYNEINSVKYRLEHAERINALLLEHLKLIYDVGERGSPFTPAKAPSLKAACPTCGKGSI